ncbi:arginine--tRNA ligase [Candidatus Epulonipiscium fishelsonii]|uniref:Arginine--tRNA ligase n=1 Tax=Candidatus Epulonipiscium fishelsonii TaxID=77094 RepID=A0ACC8XAK5_9FIRM|nr:arginine--tRNA ligase [Epulopiscium sp. SCG-B11WGA-EpuloA1]ONI40139.1 arginine--tRNA ligase [Epulopiscium sp. SCG-B05WGA-EpuloA1]ONI48001.1 arginine--tRNA ligase [Epulopiscium sp. SCG-C06WGA-EpuloA1]
MKNKLVEILNKNIPSLDKQTIDDLIEVPLNSSMGDYAFPCFKLAKELKKSPVVIAKEIAEKIGTVDFIEKTECVNAYINFFVNKEQFVKQTIVPMIQQGEKYGIDKSKSKGNIIIDFSSPNIAKPFHIGHLRSTVIGNSLYRIFEALGYNCISINHLGDWGTQFGKLIVAYKNYSSKEAVEQKGIQELLRIYVMFHEEAEKDSTLEQQARDYFTKMEQGDEEALELWKWFKQISLKEFEYVYNLLDVEFDSFNGEAFYNDKMAPVIKELEDKNLIKVSDGAKIVELENMPPCLITKRDGSTLYATRDITAAKYRKQTYDFKKCIYVTALQQNLHFKQWFEVIKKMGYEWYKDLVHVPFGMVSIEAEDKSKPAQAIATRKGNVILLQDLLNQAIQKTKEIIEEKNPNLEDKDTVAMQVGIGAIIFDDMYNTIIKDIEFSWSKALNFDGETGPYVQYTHARACSVLRKSNIEEYDISLIDFDLITDEASITLVKQIGNFKSAINDAANKYEPSIIARYAVNVAQAFNKFYHDNAILVDDQKLKYARLSLVYCTTNILKNTLYLLGIGAPIKM